MNRKWLPLIILFICLSLAGIILVQYLWIRTAIQVKEAQFNRSVNDALGAVVTKLETAEKLNLISKRLISDSIKNLILTLAQDSLPWKQSQIDSEFVAQVMVDFPPEKEIKTIRVDPPDPYLREFFFTANSRIIPTPDEDESLFVESQEKIALQDEMLNIQFEWNAREMERLDSIWVIQEQEIHKRRKEPQHYYEKSRNAFRDYVRNERRDDPYMVPEEDLQKIRPGTYIVHTYSMPPAPPIAIAISPEGRIKNRASIILEDKVRKLSKRTEQLQELIRRMAIEFEELPKPVESRIDKENLESTIRSSLANKEIYIPYEFAVYSPINDSNPVPIRSEGFQSSYLNSNHRVALFPNDVIERPEQLMLFFPGQKTHLLKSLSFLMIGSLLFTIIIFLSSGLSIFIMIRQKKISDIKTDFINNMTHEFKTPIATISIAADSINNPKVIDSPEQIKTYTRVIKEENSRMNTRVEQVLQMALLDSRDFNLHPEPLRIQEVIERTVNHFRLIVEKRNGALDTRFEAENSLVMADESHIRNVLMNLLDNAFKYSLASPEITVFTYNRSGKVCFGVKDKGIGMSHDVQRRIFDKFFRLTSGNVHNIKGFGLGLSYVKAIVLAHKGEIQVESEPGKGSTFTIMLPVCPESVNENGNNTAYV